MCAGAAGTREVKLVITEKCSWPKAFQGVSFVPAHYKAHISSGMDKYIFQISLFVYWFQKLSSGLKY